MDILQVQIFGLLVKANANGYEEIVENYSNGIFDIISTTDEGFVVTGVSNGRLWLAKFSLEANGLPSPSPTVPELSWFLLCLCFYQSLPLL